MFEELNIFLKTIDNYDVISENSNSAKLKVNYQTLKKIGFENILKFNSGSIIKAFTIETESNGNNGLLLDNYTSNKLTKEEFNQIKNMEFMIHKTKIQLEDHEIFYLDIKNFIENKFDCKKMYSIVYNVDRNIEGPINFVKISNSQFLENKRNNKIEKITDYRCFIKTMDYTNDELTLSLYNYIDYVSIISTFSFITEQKEISDTIELKGDKHVNINNITPSNCSMDNETRKILIKLNSHLNSEDLHAYDKNKILIKVLTVYLNDNSNIKEFIEKLEKIYTKASDSIENYINKNVENYFNNHNKLIEEVINTCNKITDVTNKSITQLLSVITAILASLFFYIYKKDDLDIFLFTKMIIVFILLVGLIIVIHHSFNYKYYKRFIGEYFEVIDNIYSFKESEQTIKSKLISPALRRYKNTIIRIAILMSLFVLIGMSIIIGTYITSYVYLLKLLLVIL